MSAGNLLVEDTFGMRLQDRAGVEYVVGISATAWIYKCAFQRVTEMGCSCLGGWLSSEQHFCAAIGMVIKRFRLCGQGKLSAGMLLDRQIQQVHHFDKCCVLIVVYGCVSRRK